jgi:hypothetical protein
VAGDLPATHLAAGMKTGNRSRVGWLILEELDGSSSVRALVLGYRPLVRDAGSIWKMAASAHH